MGFRDEAENAANSRCMAVSNGRDLAGVPSSQRLIGKIRDLRHPNPVRPFFRSEPSFMRASTRTSRRLPHEPKLGRSIVRTAEFWPWAVTAAGETEEITVKED